MAKIMRIVCCVLACLFVAAAIPVGALFGWVWFLVPAVIGALFAGLMLLFKKRSEPKAPPAPDFMNTDEENARRREELEKFERDRQSGTGNDSKNGK